MIPPGTASPPYAPLMATTGICGNRRRTTDRNSKPDICGMFRSETMTSGTDRFICNRASKPLLAVATSYPADVSSKPIVFRTLSSSSTSRICYLEQLGMALLLRPLAELTDEPRGCHAETLKSVQKCTVLPQRTRRQVIVQDDSERSGNYIFNRAEQH